ncbi:polysaccharide biosynthesis protein [Rhodopirellula bahusiensis]|uniref:polysaccharide biosynthesis protein n=1 Tax=Rhodopirellula bahusiensis TaxID=2014065 RepID=UPI003264EA52
MENKILITGAGGYVGLNLVRYYCERGYMVHAVDRSESAIGRLLDFASASEGKIQVSLFDVGDYTSILEASSKCNWIIHCAAFKRVDVGRKFPCQLALENLRAFFSVVQAAQANRVEKVLLCSTDKAATPKSVMGASKLLLERVASYSSNAHTTFASIRFANILNSTGSLIPICISRLKENRGLVIRDVSMTRYLIDSSTTMNLVDHAMQRMGPGDIFLPHVRSAKVLDILHVLRALFCARHHRDESDVLIKPVENVFDENVDERMIAKEDLRFLRMEEGHSVLNYSSVVSDETHSSPAAKRLLSSSVDLANRSELVELLHEMSIW